MPTAFYGPAVPPDPLKGILMRRCNQCDRLLEARNFRDSYAERCTECARGKSLDDLEHPGEDNVPPRWWQERAARAERNSHAR